MMRSDDRDTTTKFDDGRRFPAASSASLFFAILVIGLLSSVAAAREYSLFDQVQGAEVIVTGEVLSAKFIADIQVDEILKGEVTKEKIEVRFRGKNYDRERFGEDKIQFFAGERVLLFLNSRDEKDRKKEKYILFPEDVRGKLLLHDKEETTLLLETVRYCQRTVFDSREALEEVWREMARQPNVYTRLAGLESLEYARLLDESSFPLLVALYEDQYPTIRESVLRLTRLVAERSGVTLEGKPEREILFQETLRLLDDPHIGVRSEALRTIRKLGDHRVLPTLRRMAESDPSQDVRYEATRLLFLKQTEWSVDGGEKTEMDGDDTTTLQDPAPNQKVP